MVLWQGTKVWENLVPRLGSFHIELIEHWPLILVDQLLSTRAQFERHFITDARYKLDQFSRVAGLPCLSWGNTCLDCVEETTHAPKELSLYISSFGGYVSRGRCVRWLLICNPFKSIPHDIFPTDLADIRIILIVLRPSALDISLQLGERHPSIIRRRNPPPSVEIYLADPLSVAVV